jgi:hypothetical protein
VCVNVVVLSSRLTNDDLHAIAVAWSQFDKLTG